MATITCARCGRTTEPLEAPPMGGSLGATLQSHVCPACWGDWVAQQTLYINHYGLQMADPDDRKRLYQAMKEFLGIKTA